jgi:polyisoprenoid-binding protein YceI
MGSQTLQRTERSERSETAAGPGTLWTIDPAHSTIGFSIKHMVVATVHGRFGAFRGTIRFDDDRPRDASVEVLIDAASIDTGERKRDEHLRSADFFDVATYPTIAFRGTRVEPLNPVRHDRWLVIGDLTIHGVTRPVELTVERRDGGPNPWDAPVLSFAATTRISRKDFAVGVASHLDGNGLVIGDDVTISLDVQAQRSPAGGR